MRTRQTKNPAPSPFRKIGLAKFSLTFSFNEEHHLLKQKQYKFLHEVSWPFIQNKYSEQKWKRIFSFMKQSECGSLVVQKNSNWNLLQSISHIQFTQLQMISITGNFENVESIIFLNMPKLQYLMLTSSQITQSKFLSKINLKNLKCLDFSKNFIKSLYRTIQRVFIPENLQGFNIFDYDKQPYSMYPYKMIQNIDFLSKLQKGKKKCYSIELICRHWSTPDFFLDKRKIIFQKKVAESIRRKYQLDISY